MNESDEHQADGVDRLVREHLDRKAGRIDASALIDRIHATRESLGAQKDESASNWMFADTNRNRKATGLNKVRSSMMWLTATAAGLLLAFVGGYVLSPESAGASVVLRDVRAVHANLIDRCYQVQYAPDPRYWNKANKLEGPSQSVLWTRGSQFWSDCHIGDLHLQIGRGEEGDFWVSPSRNKGIRFGGDASTWPDPVSLLCSINSMNVPELLDDVLADFDLTIESSMASGRARKLIWATLKPDRSHALLSSALLEVDAEDNVLLRMVLWTTKQGVPKGTATYTLMNSSDRQDVMYQLESHLDAGAEIQMQNIEPAADRRTAP